MATLKKIFFLNQRYFSVKSIIPIFGYFQINEFPAFIDQKFKIKRIDRKMFTNIKNLLKL